MPTYVCSNGEDFLVKQEDRGYGGHLVEALKVDGKTGVVTVAGQTISSSGVIGSTGAVTATTVTASGDVSVGDDLSVTDDASVGGDLSVTGAVSAATGTIGGSAIMTGSIYSLVHLGANAGGGATHVDITAAQVDDVLLVAANLTTPGDVTADFEGTVTVAGELQQTAANLSAAQVLFLFHRP
jgi:hypothetical protein